MSKIFCARCNKEIKQGERYHALTSSIEKYHGNRVTVLQADCLEAVHLHCRKQADKAETEATEQEATEAISAEYVDTS